MGKEMSGFRLITLDEIDSTNRYLADLCASGNPQEFTVVCADYQTAGKGQRGNSWESARGENLLFSLLLRPVWLEPRRQFVLSQLVALAIRDELEALVGGEVCIKWPNDVYWREKKLCGILIEHDLQGEGIGRSICGVGININQYEFVSGAPNPVSLWQITGRRYDRMAVLEGILRRLWAGYEALRADTAGVGSALSARYEACLFRREGIHLYKDTGGVFPARILRVGPDGRFVLLDKEGRERSYLFKEVQYVLPED